jgi:hypothetical protein
MSSEKEYLRTIAEKRLWCDDWVRGRWPMNKYRVYTGPTLVKSAANRLRGAGLVVTVEGTEHVHVLALDVSQVLQALPRGGWSYRDVQLLP